MVVISITKIAGKIKLATLEGTPKSSAKSIRKICGVNHLPKDSTSDEIIREVRKH